MSEVKRYSVVVKRGNALPEGKTLVDLFSNVPDMKLLHQYGDNRITFEVSGDETDFLKVVEKNDLNCFIPQIGRVLPDVPFKRSGCK